LTRGEQIGSKGYFYKPTILKNVTPNMRMGQEEVFGPAAPIMVADDEIWTQDLDKAEKLSRMIQSGMVTVNNDVISEVPFGGFGRELSRYGMLY